MMIILKYILLIFCQFLLKMSGKYKINSKILQKKFKLLIINTEKIDPQSLLTLYSNILNNKDKDNYEIK